MLGRVVSLAARRHPAPRCKRQRLRRQRPLRSHHHLRPAVLEARPSVVPSKVGSVKPPLRRSQGCSMLGLPGSCAVVLRLFCRHLLLAEKEMLRSGRAARACIAVAAPRTDAAGVPLGWWVEWCSDVHKVLHRFLRQETPTVNIPRDTRVVMRAHSRVGCDCPFQRGLVQAACSRMS